MQFPSFQISSPETEITMRDSTGPPVRFSNCGSKLFVIFALFAISSISHVESLENGLARTPPMGNKITQIYLLNQL